MSAQKILNRLLGKQTNGGISKVSQEVEQLLAEPIDFDLSSVIEQDQDLGEFGFLDYEVF